MKLGKSGFLDLSVFLVVFIALLALYARGFSDRTGLLWWGLVLLGFVRLAWKSGFARWGAQRTQLRGGWGAVLPAKVSRWMLGEDDDTAPRNS